MSKSSKKSETQPAVMRSFNDLFGFAETIDSFATLSRADRLPQVLLFEGRPAIGKRKLLARLAALLYCEEQSGCGLCKSCHSVIHGYQPDLLWIESDGPIKVAEAELVQEHLSYQASASGLGRAQRVVVMTDIEEMTDQAANRLLKILEEPPPQSLILLSSSRPRQLLATITSRLVIWHLQPPPMEHSLQWLQDMAKRAELSFETDLLRECLERSGLAPGQAWSMVQSTHSAYQEALDRLGTLLLRPLDGRDMQELQNLLKEQGWKANELAQHFELLLNRYYKWSLGLQEESHASWAVPNGMPDLRRLRQWRRILQQIYRAGGSGHNYLNVQLAAEALGSESVL